jgi:putative DNA primase/helicase
MFQKELDQNKYLIAFKNGVYDLKLHKFRQGIPEDYISSCSPIEYDPILVDDKLNEFIDKILPLPELRKFVLKVLALTLTGIFLEKLFICIGVGANGKSSLLNLLYRVLGEDYMTSVKPQLLTKSNGNTEGPSPSFAKTRGKRCVYAEEISRKESVDIGQFKYIISRGLKSARFLNENEFDFYPFYTFFLLVNHTPHIDATDPSTWRRILCIPFLSKFVDRPDPKEPYQFKIDRDIEDKYYEQWGPAFVNILIEHLKLFQKEGLNPPDIVLRCTENYRNKCDYINSFARMYLEKSDKRSDMVTVPQVYEKFVEWYRKYKELRVPDSTEMRHLLESNYFKQEAIELPGGELGWKKYKLRDPYTFNDE